MTKTEESIPKQDSNGHLFHIVHPGMKQTYSKCGTRTNSISTTWECVRNANSQAHLRPVESEPFGDEAQKSVHTSSPVNSCLFILMFEKHCWKLVLWTYEHNFVKKICLLGLYRRIWWLKIKFWFLFIFLLVYLVIEITGILKGNLLFLPCSTRNLLYKLSFNSRWLNLIQNSDGFFLAQKETEMWGFMLPQESESQC